MSTLHCLLKNCSHDCENVQGCSNFAVPCTCYYKQPQTKGLSYQKVKYVH